MSKTTTQSAAMGKIEQQRRPSLWLAIPIVMMLTVVWTKADYPLDYWLHINSGCWMIEHGQLIDHDTFSHTIDGQPVSNQPWLAQIWMYQLHRLGGYALNQFIAGLGYAVGIVTVIYLVGRRCGNWTLAACCGCVSLGLMSTNLGIRPQYFSVVLFAAQLVLLIRGRRAVLIALGCFAIEAFWTNLHGAYPLGVVTPAIFFASSVLDNRLGVGHQTAGQVRRFAFATTAATLGCFVRPNPTDAISYVTNCGSRSVERGLVEWLPTSLGTESGAAFFASVLLLVGILAMSRRRAETREVLLLCSFLFLACSSQRMVIWWAFVLPIMVARPADQIWRQTMQRLRNRRSNSGVDQSVARAETAMDRFAGMVVLGCVIVFAIFSTPWTRSANACLPPTKRVTVLHDEPLHLVEYVVGLTEPADRNAPIEPAKNTYAPLSWGSYLTWHSGGQLKTFLDTRVDFFPSDVWNAYQEITAGGEQTLSLLAHYDVDVVICRANQHRLITRLETSDNWESPYRDDVGKVFVRR